MRKTLVAAGLFAALVWCGTGSARAQSPTDQSVFFTFSQPVALPNVTLPAGRYLFQMARQQATRTIVQVYTADRSKLMANLMTIPIGRVDPANDVELRFMEAPANSPLPVRSWWYPGIKIGYEFVYPHEQAVQLAKTASQPVLTTAQDVPNDQMSSAKLVRVDKNGQETAVSAEENPTPEQVTGTAQPGQIGSGSTAMTSSSESASASRQSATPSSTPSSTAATSSNASTPAQSVSAQTPSRSTTSNTASSSDSSQTTRSTLPQTASLMPIVAFAAGFALVAAVTLRARRRSA